MTGQTNRGGRVSIPTDLQMSVAELRGLTECRCHMDYICRGMTDPDCHHHERESVDDLANEITRLRELCAANGIDPDEVRK